jgi:16S rRNA processing protein RimM
MKKKDPFEAHFYLGKIIKTHGFDGKVTAYLDTDEPEYYHNQKMVFLNMRGSLVPYFINQIKILNNKATITFQDVDDIEGSEILVSKEMYLPLSELPKLTGNKFYFHEVIGFTVIDKSFGEVGVINEIMDYPNQAVIQIFRKEKEVLIPINDDVIDKVDRKAKTITVTTPEGLLDIYL